MIKELQLKIARFVINKADDGQLQEIAEAVCRARDRRYPDDEAIFISIPRRDRKERQQVLESFQHMMMRE